MDGRISRWRRISDGMQLAGAGTMVAAGEYALFRTLPRLSPPAATAAVALNLIALGLMLAGAVSLRLLWERTRRPGAEAGPG